MGTSEMGEMLLLGGGGRGSIISRSLRTEMPFSPSSLCPTPSPAGQSSGFHSELALAAGDPTHPLWTNHQTP